MIVVRFSCNIFVHQLDILFSLLLISFSHFDWIFNQGTRKTENSVDNSKYNIKLDNSETFSFKYYYLGLYIFLHTSVIVGRLSGGRILLLIRFSVLFSVLQCIKITQCEIGLKVFIRIRKRFK